jgi:hypothetical protein
VCQKAAIGADIQARAIRIKEFGANQVEYGQVATLEQDGGQSPLIASVFLCRIYLLLLFAF